MRNVRGRAVGSADLGEQRGDEARCHPASAGREVARSCAAADRGAGGRAHARASACSGRAGLLPGSAPLRGAQVIPDDVLQERGHRTDTMIAGERTHGGDDPSKLDHP